MGGSKRLKKKLCVFCFFCLQAFLVSEDGLPPRQHDHVEVPRRRDLGAQPGAGGVPGREHGLCLGGQVLVVVPLSPPATLALTLLPPLLLLRRLSAVAALVASFALASARAIFFSSAAGRVPLAKPRQHERRGARAVRDLRGGRPVVLGAARGKDLDVPSAEVAPVPADGRQQGGRPAAEDDEGLAAGASCAGDEEDVDALCRGLIFFFFFGVADVERGFGVSFPLFFAFLFCEAYDRRERKKAGPFFRRKRKNVSRVVSLSEPSSGARTALKSTLTRKALTSSLVAEKGRPRSMTPWKSSGGEGVE